MPAGTWLQGVLVRIARQAKGDIAVMDSRPKRAIHSLRKRMKKVQSLLRLAEAALDEKSFETVKTGIREIKNVAMSRRDADVLADLGEELGVEMERPNVARPDAEMLEVFVSELEDRFAELDLRGLTWKGVTHSHLKTCRRARKAWKKAQRHPNTETLHAWRKRVKEQYHQSLALHRWLGQDSRLRRMRRLGSLLGRCHDLDLFALTMELDSGGTDRKLCRKMGRRRKKLTRRIFHRAEKIFTQPMSKTKERVNERLSSDRGLAQ